MFGPSLQETFEQRGPVDEGHLLRDLPKKFPKLRVVQKFLARQFEEIELIECAQPGQRHLQQYAPRNRLQFLP